MRSTIEFLFFSLIFACSFAYAVDRSPNFVIIFTDDQGYGDLSCFGADHVATPRMEQMAAEGSRLTSFYVAAPSARHRVRRSRRVLTFLQIESSMAKMSGVLSLAMEAHRMRYFSITAANH